jgi:hypothetical protein
MHSLFPIAEIRDKFDSPVELQQFGLNEYNEIVRLKAGAIAGLALNVWNRIVHSDTHDVNPMALSRYIDNANPNDPQVDPQIVCGIEEVIGAKVIRDISYSRCTLNDSASSDDELIAELLIAHVYPNDLHWADVHFRNPRQPLSKRDRRFKFREFRGFGLLSKVAARITAYASAQGMDYITLTAAANDLVPLFATHGFTLETNEMGGSARAMQKRPR